MPASAVKDAKFAIGRPLDRLTLDERVALTGKIVAMEVYTPERVPLARIEAIGDTVEDCIAQLVSRGLEPLRFEFSRLHAPF
jgi:hypothetical protein